MISFVLKLSSLAFVSMVLEGFSVSAEASGAVYALIRKSVLLRG